MLPIHHDQNGKDGWVGLPFVSKFPAKVKWSEIKNEKYSPDTYK